MVLRSGRPATGVAHRWAERLYKDSTTCETCQVCHVLAVVLADSPPPPHHSNLCVSASQKSLRSTTLRHTLLRSDPKGGLALLRCTGWPATRAGSATSTQSCSKPSATSSMSSQGHCSNGVDTPRAGARPLRKPSRVCLALIRLIGGEKCPDLLVSFVSLSLVLALQRRSLDLFTRDTLRS